VGLMVMVKWDLMRCTWFLFLLGCLQAREPIKQAGILEGRIDGIKETCLLVSL
jgi:hypothetical protein